MKLFLMYMMMEFQMVLIEVWIHPLNPERYTKGQFYQLYLDQRHFPDKFFENCQMSTHQFDDILTNNNNNLFSTTVLCTFLPLIAFPLSW